MIEIELIGAPAFAVSVSGTVFTYTAVNQRFSALVGLSASSVVGRSPQTLLSPDFAALVQDQYRRCVGGRQSVDFESSYAVSGRRCWWHTTVSPVFDGEEGEVVRLIGVVVDITARKDAERRSREIDDRLALAMDVLDGGFWHYAIASGEFRISPHLGRLVTGTACASLDGARYASFVAEEDRSLLDIGPLVRGEVETMEAEYRITIGMGDLRWVSCRRRLTRDDAGRPENVIGVVVNITDHKLRQAHLAAQAATDSLTDLMNRRGFEAMGQGLAASARGRQASFGLVLLDLDRFKAVNDTHGHAVGDEVLREVGARLRRHTRPDDAAVRLGGDEFAILAADATRDVLAGLARRLAAAVGQPIATSAGRIAVGASVGAALWSAGDRDLADLTARADVELLAVKREGRGAARVAA